MSINAFLVHDSLTIANISVEKKRVSASYTIVKTDGSEVSNQLIYSYDQNFFDPNSAKDINLASIMLAQVAVNYGIFFKRIIFDGLYDKHDQRFLIDMIDNTSREIYVNKLQKKNEFLLEEYSNITFEKLSTYTQAEISFRNTKFDMLTLTHDVTSSDFDHYAILSSGGKDSLLTYGIIKELGVAHPIYINESGRHWFSAINAYRHFKEMEPNVVKPWCNSDRVFNWMVKQMPFIRPNFQDIRADIYPIRLWTVAVFLFGVLPVVRRRKIGNILIGNEYDTTMRSSPNGVTDYFGLYDQSKYFDNTLTRYFIKKGWNIRQYSILRSLSELLILKILVKRYPDLQRYQISCHAAHEVEGMMRPCGNCEKCRRIIGMLIALDEDPRRCGYTDAQIKKGLQTLSKKSVKQIGSDAAHLYYLLTQKGALPKNEHTNKLAKYHDEIMKLRFDQIRSSLEDLPSKIRNPLFKILTQYADGCVIMNDQKWVDYNVLAAYQKPYFLDSKSTIEIT